ncbi:transposase [uncultured Lamprocystis sp.]|jgi:putative transposase|uniref:REP-associated tyrosine transposase n=1 Tax=uncultured Lamprocystis sp. TaxID=543132 RepID=UPI0025F4655B|nr:transposase [uncultured Lamprocystis sp.]
MSNYRRVYIPGGAYFFTVVTHNRRPIFTTDNRVDILRDALRKVKVSHPFDIDAIVVLPEHLHCIWRLPSGDIDFSSRWREIKKAASRQIDPTTNRRNERMVWQRRFWEHAIRNEEDWRKHVDYIHYNPVKHGLAKRPGDWRWSSFKTAVLKGWYDPSWGDAEPANINGMDCE